jgi:hypothetical protein
VRPRPRERCGAVAAARALLAGLGREAGAVEDEQRGHSGAEQGVDAVEAEVDVAGVGFFGLRFF